MLITNAKDGEISKNLLSLFRCSVFFSASKQSVNDIIMWSDWSEWKIIIIIIWLSSFYWLILLLLFIGIDNSNNYMYHCLKIRSLLHITKIQARLSWTWALVLIELRWVFFPFHGREILLQLLKICYIMINYSIVSKSLC